MGSRRPSRRRRRRPAAPAPPAVAVDQATTDEAKRAEGVEPPAASGGGCGKAALVLALLLGTFLERVAASALSPDELDLFHLVMAIGVALLVARWYRAFMRRTLARSRERRRATRADRE